MEMRIGEKALGATSAALVFQSLRDDIITMRLEPGAFLQRTELQTRFGLSSTPVRDALMRLQDERLVEIFPQHATKVAPIDLALARETQFLRRSVEIEIVGTLAQHPDASLHQHLKRLIQQQIAFADLGEIEAFTQADHAFHLALYDAVGMTNLWHLVRQRAGHIDRLRRLNLPVEGKMREIIAFHSRIAEAIAAGDGAGAQSAMRDHLSRSLELAEALRGQFPKYFR